METMNPPSNLVDTHLPIDELRSTFEAHPSKIPLVISAPTGSGKSTQIPRWCLIREERISAEQGLNPKPILVIEPRRVACQSLAKRVAELEHCQLGKRVGYSVRDDDCSSDKTLIRFVTTGVALRIWRNQRFKEYGAVVIDEFHERSLELDLLLALCQAHPHCSLIVMSATFAADHLAKHLKGIHLQGEGRRFDVEVSYHPHGNTAPSRLGLLDALPSLIDRACEAVSEAHPNVLVFLPGKGEIMDVMSQLAHRWRSQNAHQVREVVPLHGGLTLKEQVKVFDKTSQQRVILATNVAETSLTVPKVGIVIDSGLVRQTRYDRGRGALSLTEVAHDSAEQRRGRAGRLSEGLCWRMWSQGTALKPFTSPEIHRESLSSLLLASAACGVSINELTLLDPPKEGALEDAQRSLNSLGVFDESGVLTSCGAALFSLGMDLALGRWLIEGLQGDGPLDDLLDLVSALSVSRSIFLTGPNPDLNEELRAGGCDAVGLIKAMRVPISATNRYHLNTRMLHEALEHRKRLMKALKIQRTPNLDQHTPIKRQALALALLRADPRSAYVLRLRRHQEAWVGGGPEMSLHLDTAITLEREHHARFKPEALFVLDQHAMITKGRTAEHRITLAMPVQLVWLKQVGLGEERLGEANFKRGKLTVSVERVFAKKILDTYSVTPKGNWARQALISCLLKGQVWSGLMPKIEGRLERLNLERQLLLSQEKRSVQTKNKDEDERYPSNAQEWLLQCLETLGFEDPDDLALLSIDDVLPPELEEEQKNTLNKTFPRRLDMSDARYIFHYDVPKRKVIMEQVSGSRRSPPRPEWLPQCGGFEVRLKQGQHDSALRARKHSKF
jgi:ATP-dependent helicase HrpB